MKYEVVCTRQYYDVGLAIERDDDFNPTRVLAGTSMYNYPTDKPIEYGAAHLVNWIGTGVFLSQEEWKKISYNRTPFEILNELGIEKKDIEVTRVLKELNTKKKNVETQEKDKKMDTIKQVDYDKAVWKTYNIEWYLGNGKVQTTSAILTNIIDGYIHFVYPDGGLFVIETKALRSMECIEG